LVVVVVAVSVVGLEDHVKVHFGMSLVFGRFLDAFGLSHGQNCVCRGRLIIMP
jgi:uncharacterized membrane protein YecN with MAPEG domain